MITTIFTIHSVLLDVGAISAFLCLVLILAGTGANIREAKRNKQPSKN